MEQETDAPVKNSRLINRPSLISLLVSSVFLLTIILTQDPSGGGPILILLFLGTLFSWLFSVAWILLHLFSAKILKQEFSSLRFLYTSVAVAAGLVFLIGLQTLRQLQFADIVLMVAFQLLLNFYLLRRF